MSSSGRPDSEPPPVWPDAPRRCPGRAFPPHRYVPGLNARPEEEASGFDWGIDLYHAGYLWEAHEAWEGVWRSETDPVRREFVQGLIQMAASVLKAHVGEARGSRTLAERALGRLRSCGDSCMGLDVRRIVEALESGTTPPRLADAPSSPPGGA